MKQQAAKERAGSQGPEECETPGAVKGGGGWWTETSVAGRWDGVLAAGSAGMAQLIF